MKRYNKALTPFYKGIRLFVIVFMAVQVGRAWGMREKASEPHRSYIPSEIQMATEPPICHTPTEPQTQDTPFAEEIKFFLTDDIPLAPTVEPSRKEYNGIFEGDIIAANITHYDVCRACCGKTDGITASGFKIKNGMDDPYIVACNWLPFDSVISIDGIEYTVKDRGGKGLNPIGRIDIFVPDGHAAALELGRIHGELVIVSIGGD